MSSFILLFHFYKKLFLEYTQGTEEDKDHTHAHAHTPFKETDMSGEKVCTVITRMPEDSDEGLWKLTEGVSVKFGWRHQRRPDKEYDILAGPRRVTKGFER